LSHLSILGEYEWGDLEFLYKVCQAAITDGGLFQDIGVKERGKNERQSENKCDTNTGICKETKPTCLCRAYRNDVFAGGLKFKQKVCDVEEIQKKQVTVKFNNAAGKNDKDYDLLQTGELRLL